MQALDAGELTPEGVADELLGHLRAVLACDMVSEPPRPDPIRRTSRPRPSSTEITTS